MPNVRFSKANLLASLKARADSIGNLPNHRFTRDSGWAQVEKKPINVIVSYGAWSELTDLIIWIEEGGFPDQRKEPS